jgi:myo-inositol-1(or 4)-monophosphatase
MKLSATDLQHLAVQAIAAARAAGELVSRARPQHVEHKPGGHGLASQVVTDVDRRSEALIVRTLGPTLERFELGLLTEERDDDGGRHTKDYFWCIDPIDGTLPFIEGTPGYAVSIALVARDGTPWIGAVYDPVEHTLYHAIRGQRPQRNEQRWVLPSPPAGSALSLFTDRGFADTPGYESIVAALRGIAHDLGLEGLVIDATGGAVMNACRVLAHPPACHFKLPKPQRGGGSCWDYAATACLFEAAGAVVTDIHGDPLELNRAGSTFMSHRGVLFCTDSVLAGRIRGLYGAGPSPAT